METFCSFSLGKKEIDEVVERLYAVFIYNADFLRTAEEGIKLLTIFFPFVETNNRRKCEKRCDDTKESPKSPTFAVI